MNIQALGIFIFSCTVLTVFLFVFSSIECSEFSSDLISEKCQSDINTNLIFMLAVFVPVILVTGYYLIPTKEPEKR